MEDRELPLVEETKEAPAPPARKPYVRPTVQQDGSLASLTLGPSIGRGESTGPRTFKP